MALWVILVRITFFGVTVTKIASAPAPERPRDGPWAERKSAGLLGARPTQESLPPGRSRPSPCHPSLSGFVPGCSPCARRWGLGTAVPQAEGLALCWVLGTDDE